MKHHELTRRKILAGLGTIGVASAGAGLGTSAYFSDEESFEQNTLTAGELDLKVGWQQTYNGPKPPNGGTVETHPVNAHPDSDGDGIQDIAGVIYGVEWNDSLYAIDLQEEEAILIADTDGNPDVDSSPNGLAFDPDNRRLYYSVNTDSGNEIWFYDIAGGSNTQAGDLEAQSAGAGWYDGKYWYIKNETDDLNAVSFNADGTKASETTEIPDLTDNDRIYRFGDIAISPDGFLYGSSLGSLGSTAEFFTIDIPNGNYTELYTGNESDWGGPRDPTGLQLALDQAGTLIGQDAGDGQFYEIDVENTEVSSIAAMDDLAFTDITSREEVFLVCTRPAPERPDVFQSDAYPDLQHLIELSDVKPGDEGEITFSLRLCDNPGYLWLTLPHFVQDGGDTPEPEDTSDDGELAENMMVRLWYDTDCDNQFDDEETQIFGPGIDDYTDFGGGTPATLAEAVAVMNRNNGRIPLDGKAPFMGYDDGMTDDARDCLPAETDLCIGFEWWIPTEVENEIQGDTVEFDFGFYTEQCRHNDGSGMNGT